MSRDEILELHEEIERLRKINEAYKNTLKLMIDEILIDTKDKEIHETFLSKMSQ